MRKPREPSRILKFPARLDEVAREKAIDVGKIEIWFQDEARIGQKNKITPQVGQTRHSPERSAGSANRIDLYLRCNLPKTGQGRGSDPALLQYRSDEPAPRGNSQGGRTRSPRRPPRRPGRMASVSKIAHSRQHHHSRPAAEMP